MTIKVSSVFKIKLLVLSIIIGVVVSGCGTESEPPPVPPIEDPEPPPDEDSPPFAGGSGTLEDPFQIATIEQLQAIDDTLYLASHFIQIQDIDASASAEFQNGSGFDQIGDAEHPFTGSYDGDEYVIRDLYIHFNKSDDYNGLFGYLKEAELINIRIDNTEQLESLKKSHPNKLANRSNSYSLPEPSDISEVLTDEGVGGLAGVNDGGMIRNSHFKGFVVGFDGIGAGGLVGVNTGTIENSSFEGRGFIGVGAGFVFVNTGTILRSKASGFFEGQPVAGFVFENLGEISESYTEVELDGRLSSAGFALRNRGTIRSSFVRGTLKGNRNFGGFALNNLGQIHDSYVLANQELTLEDASDATYRIAGFVTNNFEEGVIKNIYFSDAITIDGSVELLEAIGGITASNSGIIEGAYWDAESTGLETGIDKGEAGETTGLTTAQMTGLSAAQNMPGFDFETVWATTPEGYPVLRWQLEE